MNSVILHHQIEADPHALKREVITSSHRYTENLRKTEARSRLDL